MGSPAADKVDRIIRFRDSGFRDSGFRDSGLRDSEFGDSGFRHLGIQGFGIQGFGIQGLGILRLGFIANDKPRNDVVCGRLRLASCVKQHRVSRMAYLLSMQRLLGNLLPSRFFARTVVQMIVIP